MIAPAIVVRDVRLLGADTGEPTDVRIAGGFVEALGAVVPRPGDHVVDGAGGALIPGLWDHHIHLVALAAARASTPAGPPDVRDADELGRTLRSAAPSGGWVRAVGYHDSVAGDLDRNDLDRLAPGRAVRLQHRSGQRWTLSSEALDRLELGNASHPGIERGPDGSPSGRFTGADDFLRDHLPRDAVPVPDLAGVGAHLASCGVVGVTDATPYRDLDDLDLLADARHHSTVRQHVVVMGGPELTTARLPVGLDRGPVKILLADHALPGFDQLRSWIERAHDAGRPVAVHSVTRLSLALVVAALADVGARADDRIEHASVAPPELIQELALLGVQVVTQPNLVAERGDRYLIDVDPEDRDHLYPCAGLLEAGVAVGGSTDAPFGNPDPWRAIAAAIDRRTTDGRTLGPQERVASGVALGLFLGPWDDPGGPRRRVAVGASADLCLLDRRLDAALESPSSSHVRATFIAGVLAHDDGTI